MNKNLSKLFIPFSTLIALFFIDAGIATEKHTENYEGEPTSTTLSTSLENQVERVAKFIVERKLNNLPVKMVLGAKNTECTRISDDSWIFFDMNSHDAQGRAHLQASFNDLSHLATIAKGIGHSLDQIVVDSSTFKFASWRSEHIQSFASMLTPGGEFVFSPFVESYGVAMVQFSDDEKSWNAIKNENTFPSDRIQVNFSIPYSVILAPEDLSLSEVQKTVEKYKVLRNFTHLRKEDFDPSMCGDCDEFDYKTSELGLGMIDIETLCNDEKLTLFIANDIKENNVIMKIRKEIHIPHVLSFFTPYFEKVTVDYDGPYPFTTNYDYQSIIYAKNPK